ncbi:MAG TPA: hypothetical protein VFX70_13180 [Mycobacteriales bacterium]|nr:hypothetical protein [Mycobacteriales bacterium]
MNVVTLVCWVAAALGGFYLLATWLQSGGMRQQHHGPTRFPVVLIFGHFLLAGVGMLVWLVYLFDAQRNTAMLALAIIAVTAVLGFVMFARWLPGQVHPPAAEPVTPDGRAAKPTADAAAEPAAEQQFPIASVVGHGALAAVTLVLVLIVALRA